MTDYERYGDYQPSERGFGTGSAFAFVFIGLAAGALIALLLAPQPGQKTRRMLRRRYEDAVEGISERADVLRERADAWRERGGEWAESARQNVPFRKARGFRR